MVLAMVVESVRSVMFGVVFVVSQVVEFFAGGLKFGDAH